MESEARYAINKVFFIEISEIVRKTTGKVLELSGAELQGFDGSRSAATWNTGL